MVRKYSVYQRGSGKRRNYAKYQRGGLVRYRRRRVQKGSGFFGVLARVGKKIIKSKAARKILKDVVMPMVMDKASKYTT